MGAQGGCSLPTSLHGHTQQLTRCADWRFIRLSLSQNQVRFDLPGLCLPGHSISPGPNYRSARFITGTRYTAVRFTVTLDIPGLESSRRLIDRGSKFTVALDTPVPIYWDSIHRGTRYTGVLLTVAFDQCQILEHS